MIKIACILLMIPLLSINSCSDVEKEEIVSPQAEITGKWVYKNIFLGDAIDTPCGYATKQNRDITIEILENKDEPTKKNYKLSGQSVVNQLFGFITIDSHDKSLNINYITIGQLGSTKVAGPEDQMICETRFFNMLNESKELRLAEGKLLIGTFKKDDKPSRDGGTYMIFERVK